LTKGQLDQLDDHYLALGRFAAQFATTEVAIFGLMVSLSGIDPKLGPAVFGSMKVDGCIATIRRLSEARDEPLNPAIEKSLVHLKQISEVRNAILHYGTAHDIDSPAPSPTARSGHSDRAKIFDVSVSAIDALTRDVTDIGVLFLLYPARHVQPDIFRDHSRTISEGSWLYRPPPQASKGRRRQLPR